MRVVLAIAAALSLALALMAVPAGAQQAVRSEQLLLFERNREVVTARADGSDVTRIAPPNPEVETADEPVWSPDASLVAYVHFDRETQGGQVRVVNARGTGDRLVLDAGIDVDWAPDGQRLVVSVPGRGLVVVNRDGTGERQITSVPGESDIDGQPRWSPDGSTIAFTRFDRLAGVPSHTLFLVDADGGNLRQVTDGDQMVESLDWAPDGSRLVFHIEQNEPEPRDSDIFTVDRTGTQLVQLTDNAESWWPAWSPDGSMIALTVGYAWDDPRDLFLMDADGTNLRRIASGPPDHDLRQPSWSPDGARVAMTGATCCIGDQPRIAHDVFVVEADGSAMAPITDDQLSMEPKFAPDAPVAFQITERIAGPTRYETAVALSQATYDTADTVVVARGDEYADALAAAPLAGRHDAPVLLSPPEGVPDDVVDEVGRLGAARAFLLGGTAALSAQVEQDLRDAGVAEIVRLAGADRFDTARLVADELAADHAYVVEGIHRDPERGWPDAVAVSALAAHEAAPILLVTGDRLPPPTQAAIQDNDIATATIVGGTAAVGEEVAQALRDEGVTVDRLAGPDRYTTALRVAERSAERGLDPGRTWVATGIHFADALTGGPAAAADGGVLLLIQGMDAERSPAAMSWFDAHAGTFERIVLVGGLGVISDQARRQIERAAR